MVQHVKLLILCGATADAIEKAVRECPDYHGSPEIVRCESLEDCVKTAYERAVRGDIVTLSPACAAFDQFANFMERGKAFKKLVMALRRIGKSPRGIGFTGIGVKRCAEMETQETVGKEAGAAA